LAWQNLQLERNGALFEVHGLVRFKVLDTADIVRDEMLRQLPLRESSSCWDSHGRRQSPTLVLNDLGLVDDSDK
jgi:hypothetical protein